MKPRFDIECGRCPRMCYVRISEKEDGTLQASGYGCHRGLDIANIEANRKRHAIKSYVPIEGSSKMLRVGLTRKVYDEISPRVMEEIGAYVAKLPVRRKQVLIEGVAGTKANLIALSTIKDA